MKLNSLLSVRSSLIIGYLLDDRRVPHPTKGHLPQRYQKAMSLLRKQFAPQNRDQPIAVAHRSLQARAPESTTLEN